MKSWEFWVFLPTFVNIWNYKGLIRIVLYVIVCQTTEWKASNWKFMSEKSNEQNNKHKRLYLVLLSSFVFSWINKLVHCVKEVSYDTISKRTYMFITSVAVFAIWDRMLVLVLARWKPRDFNTLFPTRSSKQYSYLMSSNII